jgi:signal transduction histidine kinase
LDGIRDAGAQALAEADQLVTILQAERSTAPRLSELLEQARAGGAHVVVTPPGVELEPEIEAIAYRVAQEALTNAMKHAPGAALDVQVARTAGELTVTVRNDAVAEPSTIAGTGSGSGLAGMRERLAALGGSLAVGPDAEGGFRLCARLPLDSSGAAAALTSAAATAAGP